MNTIIILPVYNEADRIAQQLTALFPHARILLILDDGSTDGSAEIARKWAEDRDNCVFMRTERNRGKSHAVENGFLKVLELKNEGRIGNSDLILLTDADGQIPHDIIPSSVAFFNENGLDMLIGARDFSLYPPLKRLGNRVMTDLASILSGFRFSDTLCGFRIMNLKTMEGILAHYKARRYTCEQEMSMIPVLLGLKIDNSFQIRTNHYRSNSSWADAVEITLDTIATALRLSGGKKGLKEERMEPVTGNPE